MDLRYELDKRLTFIKIGLARRIPDRFIYWSLMAAGWRYILPDEEVPAVPLITILGRVGRPETR